MDERSRRVCSSLKKIGIPSLDEMKAPFFAKKKRKKDYNREGIRRTGFNQAF